MPLIKNWNLLLEVDQVLRAQGAAPAILRTRRPALVEIAQQALEEGLPLLESAVLYGEMKEACRYQNHYAHL